MLAIRQLCRLDPNRRLGSGSVSAAPPLDLSHYPLETDPKRTSLQHNGILPDRKALDSQHYIETLLLAYQSLTGYERHYDSFASQQSQ